MLRYSGVYCIPFAKSNSKSNPVCDHPSSNALKLDVFLLHYGDTPITLLLFVSGSGFFYPPKRNCGTVAIQTCICALRAPSQPLGTTLVSYRILPFIFTLWSAGFCSHSDCHVGSFAIFTIGWQNLCLFVHPASDVASIPSYTNKFRTTYVFSA